MDIFIKLLIKETSNKRNHIGEIISMKGSLVEVDGAKFTIGNMIGPDTKIKCELKRKGKVIDYILWNKLLLAVK